MNKIPRLIRFTVAEVLLFVVPLSLIRILFWRFFEASTDPLPYSTLLHSLYIGFKFDLRLSLLIISPVILLDWIKLVNPFYSRFGRLLWCGYFTIISFLVLLVYIVDFGHFAYLRVRLDSTVVSLLEDMAISFELVWETYPVIWLVSGLFLITMLYTYITSHLILRLKTSDVYATPRWPKVIITSVYIFLILFGIYGKLSYYPLRWSDAFFSTNSFASSIALNPVLYFYDSLKNSGVRYDEKVLRDHYDEIASYLGVEDSDKEHLNFIRQINKKAGLPGRPNVVIILLESFCYYKTQLYGSPLDSAPNFDAMAGEGILFDHFYTPHWGTARSVFTMVTGIPDVETNNTSTRNPAIVCQHTIINAFEGYEKFYFLGGSASWGNIRGLLSSNIPGLRIYEEGSYESPRIDVWGISDLSLFQEAHKILSRNKDKPFFAIIHTAGNHRPYSIPADNQGFKMLNPELSILKRYGFESVEELNAFRFMDHAIGIFLDMAKRESYFDNTIFVFLGDHGNKRDGGELTPVWETQLGLTGFHVPFLIYAPKLIPQGKVYHKIASEVDVLPTIAGLALSSYKNTTLGRDLLDARFDNQRYAFIIVHSTVPEISLLSDRFYFLMNEDGTNKRVHLLDYDKPAVNVITQFPDKAAAMERRLRVTHETSKYMLYHNDCQ